MLIAKRTFKKSMRWWRVHTDGLSLCASRLSEVFDIPHRLNTITIALYTKPGPQRVRLMLWTTLYGNEWLIVTEKPLLKILPGHAESYDIDVPNCTLPEVRKSKRKIFYAEVSWEE